MSMHLQTRNNNIHDFVPGPTERGGIILTWHWVLIVISVVLLLFFVIIVIVILFVVKKKRKNLLV